MLVECPQCKVPRELTRDRGKVCVPCGAKNARNDNWTAEGYRQTCDTCDLKWITKTDTKAVNCKSCAAKLHRGKPRKKPEELIRYLVTCSDCGVERQVSQNPKHRKTTLCGLCSRKAIGKANKKKELKAMLKPKPKTSAKIKGYTVKQKLDIISKHTGKFFRYCPSCPDDCNTIEVDSKSLSGIKYCSDHKPVKAKSYKKSSAQKKKEENKTPIEAIKAAREINRKHREAVQEKVKEKAIPQTRTDDDMIAEFLSKNEPSIKFVDSPMPHIVSGIGLGSSTSVMSS